MIPRHLPGFPARVALACAFAFACTEAPATEFTADPDSYGPLLRGLQAGDSLLLAPGIYRDGLRVHNLAGTASAPIRIRAADPARRPRFVARFGANTVSLVDVEHVEIADLDLDGLGLPVDGVKAEGHARFAHHVTLERLRIVNHGANQQTVGISTKCPARGWVIRDNEIVRAGTGMYLGNSDGTAPFVGGLVEGNLVVDTIGYNLQIKHQNARPTDVGLPSGRSTTEIRYNVFSKARNGSTGELARPNVLVGHLPPAGDGATDRYLIHGNLFHSNPTEALFQGEGHFALYSNVFVNYEGSAIHIQPHNGVPGAIDVFDNTVLAAKNGIRVTGGDPAHAQRVRNNVVFAETALSGGDQAGNLAGTPDLAVRALRRAVGPLEQLDLRLQRPARGASRQGYAALPGADRDFCGLPRTDDRPGAFADGAPAARLSIRRRMPPASPCGVERVAGNRADARHTR